MSDDEKKRSAANRKAKYAQRPLLCDACSQAPQATIYKRQDGRRACSHHLDFKDTVRAAIDGRLKPDDE